MELVCLDADLYKVGGDWERDWEQTVTILTGGGGEHLIFRHPAGEHIGGSNRGLPKFIDVRAHGGQFVAPPSLHPSGNVYAWEEDYGPHQIELAELPEQIAELLRTAVTNEPVIFSQNGIVDLERYASKLPGLVMALLNDDRSKIDFWIIRAMVKAGMTPDEIKASWDNHDPTGKYSDKNGQGADYLGRTIANAESHLATRQQHQPTYDEV